MPQDVGIRKQRIESLVIRLVAAFHIEPAAGQQGELAPPRRPGGVVEQNSHLPHGNAARGGSAPRPSIDSAMRSPSFHFAIRSDRANEPTFNRGAPHPTARWTIVTSSVSPERAETMALQPSDSAASKAALVSVSVPAWFGLIKAVLHAARAAAACTRFALVTRKSSPTTATLPAAAVNRVNPSGSSSASGSSIATIG